MKLENGKRILELGGDQFMLEFPQTSDVSPYLNWRLSRENLDPRLWSKPDDSSAWKMLAQQPGNVPDADKAGTFFDYLKKTPVLSDLTTFYTEPFLVQRVTGSSKGLGCFLVSSKDLSAQNIFKRTYGNAQKLISVENNTSEPVLSRRGQALFGYRPCLIPLHRDTLSPDTVQFQHNNPNGTLIFGGKFTLSEQNVEDFFHPLQLEQMERIEFEESEEKGLTWYAWNGHLICEQVQWYGYPADFLKLIGLP